MYAELTDYKDNGNMYAIHQLTKEDLQALRQLLLLTPNTFSRVDRVRLASIRNSLNLLEVETLIKTQ